MPLEPHGPTVDAALLATLATACRDQLRVAFDYRDGRGQASSRMVEPQGVAHASQRWYLVAWDPARDDWRIFRLDRIAGPATTARTSRRVPRLAGRPAQYVSRTLRLGAYPAHARIVLHAPRAAMAARIPSAAGEIDEVDDARCLLRCSAASLDSLTYWLMALDVEFQVLEPAALIERLRVAGERLARGLARSA